MIRIFIALYIPEQVLGVIEERLKKELGASFYQYRWVNRANLHLTLKFIGEVEEKLADKICEKLIIAQKEFDKLTLVFSKFGFFERNGKPAIFWAGCNFNPVLNGFVNYIENSLFELGIPKEVKPFKSHLTLLRLKGEEEMEPLKKISSLHFESIEFKPEAISLVKSELSPKGAKYFVIKNLVK
jgi:2'-5' RNA ligase